MGHTGNYTREEAIAAIDKERTLPDVLSFDPSKPAKYPNGRVFTDDVIDYRLAFLTQLRAGGGQRRVLRRRCAVDDEARARKRLEESSQRRVAHPVVRPRDARAHGQRRVGVEQQ